MARKAARKAATQIPRSYLAAMSDPEIRKRWEARWEASVAYAAARYAAAVRQRADVMIDKYIEALKRRLILNDKNRERCRGA